jgi:hypothetical protein
MSKSGITSSNTTLRLNNLSNISQIFIHQGEFPQLGYFSLKFYILICKQNYQQYATLKTDIG